LGSSSERSWKRYSLKVVVRIGKQAYFKVNGKACFSREGHLFQSKAGGRQTEKRGGGAFFQGQRKGETELTKVSHQQKMGLAHVTPFSERDSIGKEGVQEESLWD